MTDDPLDVQALLGPEGPIARRLPDFEVRSQQLDFSQAVAEALKNRRHLIAEAGIDFTRQFFVSITHIIERSYSCAESFSVTE